MKGRDYGRNDLICMKGLINEDIDWYKERGIPVYIGDLISFF